MLPTYLGGLFLLSGIICWKANPTAIPEKKLDKQKFWHPKKDDFAEEK